MLLTSLLHKNNNLLIYQIAAVIILNLYFISSNLHATIYIYQLPDGSRVMTDRPKYDGVYKKLRSSQKMSGMGQIITGRYKATDTHANRKRYSPLIKQLSASYGVDVALVKAVVHAESYFNPNATSVKGASGLMQLMPTTAAIYGISDLYNPSKNIEAGVRHLRYLLKKYQYSLPFAIAAYNAGEKAVSRYNGIPPYNETQRYVKKVLRFHSYYSRWP
ncbi:Phage internal (core) protein [hydrothermal vent metagenome]|uniref:Phage internal (Core) protein n=1 Tax=hydrothermal vent metagenome TaxID=652676 RepID=A0A3B0ZZM0_9ZZZZ